MWKLKEKKVRLLLQYLQDVSEIELFYFSEYASEQQRFGFRYYYEGEWS